VVRVAFGPLGALPLLKVQCLPLLRGRGLPQLRLALLEGAQRGHFLAVCYKFILVGIVTLFQAAGVHGIILIRVLVIFKFPNMMVGSNVRWCLGTLLRKWGLRHALRPRVLLLPLKVLGLEHCLQMEIVLVGNHGAVGFLLFRRLVQDHAHLLPRAGLIPHVLRRAVGGAVSTGFLRHRLQWLACWELG